MTTRTFKQMGVAFGNQPAEITAKVDNVTVYQGTVVTLNEPVPELPNFDYIVTNELFSWTADVDFSGPAVIEITVGQGAQLLVAQLQANYNATANSTGNIVSSGPDGYSIFRWQQFGNTYINGMLQDSQSINHNELDGMWWWSLPPNSNFVENVTINPGLAPVTPV
jgi:hypothetical protein